MSEIEELLKEPEILRIINNLKNEEPIKIDGTHYIVEVEEGISFKGKEVKTVFFKPVINKEISKDPTFCVVFYGDKAGVVGSFLDTAGIKEFYEFLKKEER